jgi:general secretion pathway protein G
MIKIKKSKFTQHEPFHLAQPQRGFTLTEMLIVIALIALVGTFVLTQYMSKYDKAKVDATKIQMKQLGVILDQFKLDCGFYPTTEQGLEALLKKPGGRECRNYDPAGYIKDNAVPRDGFGNEFDYESDGKTYVIISRGADGKEGGEDLDKDLKSNDAN